MRRFSAVAASALCAGVIVIGAAGPALADTAPTASTSPDPAVTATPTDTPTDPPSATPTTTSSSALGGSVVGSLSFTETTYSEGADVLPPDSWQIEVSSDNCAPTTGTWPLTVTVPDGTQTPNVDAYVYTDDTNTTECEYLYDETRVVDFLSSFVPESPAVFPPDPTAGQPGDDGFSLNIAVINMVPVYPVATSVAGSAGGGDPREYKHVSMPDRLDAASLPRTGPARLGTMVLLALALLVAGNGLTLAGAPPRYGGRHRG